MTTARSIDSLVGTTLRWTFTEGPAQGSTFEHTFHENGTVTWKGVEGPAKCASVTEQRYSAEKVSEDVFVVSYKAANGYTLTVALNIAAGAMVGFASNDKQWFEQKGTFEIL